MQSKRIDPLRLSGLLLPAAVAGMLAGFTASCTAKSEEKPASGAPAAEKAATDTAAAAKHACKGMNACKGQCGCSSGDAGCAGKNSCKGKGGCAVPSEHK